MAMKSSCALALLVATTLGPVPPASAEVELKLVARSPPFAHIEHPAPCSDSTYFSGSPLAFLLYSASTADQPELPVVDQTVPVPGTGSFFVEARAPDCTYRGVAFLGGGGDLQGVFRLDPSGDVHLILARGIELNGLILGVVSLLDADERSGNQALRASVGEVGVQSGHGVVFMPAGGQPVLVSDFRTILPGEVAPTLVHFHTAPVGDGLAFVARSTFPRVGVYWWRPQSGISLVANLDTLAPGTSERFTGFFAVIGLDEGLVFSGWYPSGAGLFLVRGPGGAIEPLVMPGDTSEEGDTLRAIFANPGGPSRGSGRLIVFTALTEGDANSYAAFVRLPTGEIHRLMRIGDVVDGFVVEDILAVGASRTAVALRVGFQGDETAIYRADFPELAGPSEIPAAGNWGLLALAVLVTLAGVATLRRRFGLQGPA